MKRHLISNILQLTQEQSVKVYGWIASTSIFGKLLFIRLWDRSGIIQIVCREQTCFIKQARKKIIWKDFLLCCKAGTVLYVDGILANREIKANKINIISNCSEPVDVLFNEESKLSNRISYLRNHKRINNFQLQSDFLKEARNFLSKKHFTEVFTPVLSQDTAEGANVFNVTGNKANYVLCQSPQIYKQSLMCAGFDKYFQIAPCFRDEDLRNDRQPEFHQLDVEMSFCTINDIQNFFEGLITKFITSAKLAKTVIFDHINFDDCMKLYGSDKPDLRCLDEFIVCSDFCGFNIDEAKFDDMKEILDSASIDFTFYDHDDVVYSRGVINNAYFMQARIKLNKRYLLILNSSSEQACNTMFRARKLILKCFEYKFLWIDNIPMFEYKQEKIEVRHNPFCDTKKSPSLFSNNITEVLSTPSSSFDLVLNGVEILGGSIRENDFLRQQRIFDILQLSSEQKDKFDFFIRMLRSGAPIHGGAALGIERFLCNIVFETSIREFVAFPKSSSGKCLFFS